MLGHIYKAVTLAAVVAVTAASQAYGQNATDHLQHHPGGSAPAPAPAQSTPAPSTSAGGMGGMMEGGEHSDYQEPLYPKLLNLAADDAAGRRALAVQAEHRLMTAEAAIKAASRRLAGDLPRASQNRLLEDLRQGEAEYRSAATVLAALQTASHSQGAGLDWFRKEMNLEPVPHAGERGILGLSALHLALMSLLVLLGLGLLSLQVRRLSRARELLRDRASRPAATPVQAVSKIREPAPVQPGGPKTSTRRWSGQLRVAHIINETPTVETYRLVPLEGNELPFNFLPGQFLQVEVEPETGKPARRSYTIASSPTQRAYVEITVKREEHGVVSKILNEKLNVGDLLKVSGPFGSFTFTGSDAESIVLIAGGVGITPVMSVLRYLTDIAWNGEIFLLYGARETEEFVFREDIERLERRHANLHVLASMQRSPGTVWLGPEGNLTKELVSSAVPRIVERRIHLCGPPPMMTSVQSILIELGVPEAQIHTEAFGPASLPIENAPSAVTGATEHGPVQRAAARVDNSDVAATTVTFSVSGVSAPLRSDETVLEASERAGVEIPFSCRVGDCGVCVVKLLQGSVTMGVEAGLQASDKAEGYVLACQAKCSSGPLVVEA